MDIMLKAVAMIRTIRTNKPCSSMFDTLSVIAPTTTSLVLVVGMER